ncbi:MAG: sialidase family protein [Thermoplasmatota archaeon]
MAPRHGTALALLAILSVAAGCLGGAPTGLPPVPPPGTVSPSFATARVNPGGFEPRIAVGPDGVRWVSTQNATRAEVVYRSNDGVHWNRTAADPGALRPCCDNEIAVTPTGRVLTSIISGSAGSTALDVRYSDDGGNSWVPSKGNFLADQDRQWLAVGTKDKVTGGYDVYMLWHNLLSGAGDHEMLVSTSRDNGATFGPPVPVTPPGGAAWLDLQCADSGGPSNIVANPKTGQVYAIFGTRSSPAGGCGASVTGPFEINVVAATRIWVATSTDDGVTWSDSLAVDDSGAGNIVGMQVNAAALDDQGNLYVVYPESPQPYPDYEGAAVVYRWSTADLAHWSAPVTVEPAVAGGRVPGTGAFLTHVAAGDPGNLALFYLKAAPNGTKAPWFATVAVTHDGLSVRPNFTTMRVDDHAAWNGTASHLMGVCDPLGPQPFPLSDANAAANGLRCGRASDVLGQALDASCHAMFVWYDNGRLDAKAGGTYATTVAPSLCRSASAPVAPEP